VTFRKQVAYYQRIQSGMQNYCRAPLRADWKSYIRQVLECREAVWLDTLEKTIFSQPSHPYRVMFEFAGCSYQDLVQSVRQRGIEATLKQLHAAGIYLDHDEFKGIKTILRSGKVIPPTPVGFANPLVTGWFRGSSGGSRSAGTMTCTGTEQLLHLTGYAVLNAEEFGLDGFPYVIARPTLPSIAGLLFCLLYSRIGCDVRPWFAFGSQLSNSLHYRLLTNYIVALARWHGAHAPFPKLLPPNDFSPVARWIAQQPKHTRRCALQAVASTGVRVASAAMEENLDISGTLFFSGGEALTEGKRRAIEASGAEVFPAYWISEIGQIGHSCRRMNIGNTVHVFQDSVAVITQPRQTRFAQSEVNSLLFTTLLPHAPHIFINVEMQDAGFLDEKSCDCVYREAGFTHQISDIFSYGKLSGQGMTLVGTDIVRILEQDLPARFGGSPGDYQLIEQEGPKQTEILLRISPRVEVKSSDVVKHYFLQALRRYSGGALAYRVWEHSDALKITIGEPLLTRAGKLLPLYLNRNSQVPKPHRQ
jgi:hypothetical protein